MSEKNELIIEDKVTGFEVSYGNMFSLHCETGIDFLETMGSWKTLFDEVGYEELFQKVFKETPLYIMCDLSIKSD